jgi:tape measure domain-containing protein
MADRTIEIRITGKNDASGALNDVTSSLSKLGSVGGGLVGSLSDLGGSISKIGLIAGGAALVGVAALGAGIVALGASALQSIADHERLGLAVQNLYAKELVRNSGIEELVKVGTAANTLSKEQQKELDKLTEGIGKETHARDQLAIKIQLTQAELAKMEGADKRNEEAINRKRAALDELNYKFNETSASITTHTNRINELNSASSGYTDVMQKVRTGQISMKEAMGLAAEKSAELLDWIEQLAAQSPFDSEGIGQAFKMAMTFGFTADESKRLTQAMVDYVSATGGTPEIIERVSLALGKVHGSGKVTGEILNQLSEAGVSTTDILSKMGYTTADVSNGLVDADAFIEAVTKDLEIFTGAAKEQSTSFAGITSTLEEYKNVGLREFFTGTFEAIRPYVVDFLDLFDKSKPIIKAWGESFGKFIGAALKELADIFGEIRQKYLFFIDVFKLGKLTGLNDIQAGFEAIRSLLRSIGIKSDSPIFAFLDALKPLIYQVFGDASKVTQGFGDIVKNILGGAFKFLTDTVLPLLTTAITFVSDHWMEFKGAIMGVAAVLGGSVIVAAIGAIVGLLASLATPITAIVAVAALLGAAWAGNWFGIRDTLMNVWNSFIYPTVMAIYTWLSVNIPIAIQTLVGFWTGTLLPIFQMLWDFWSNTALLALTDLYNWLFTNIPIDIQAVVDFFNNVLLPTFTTVFNAIALVVSTVLGAIAQWWKEHGDSVLIIVNFIWETIKTIFTVVIGTIALIIYGAFLAIQSFWQTWGDTILAVTKVVWDLIVGYVQFAMALFGGIIDLFAALIKGDWTAFGKALQDIWKALWDFQQVILQAARDLLFLLIDAIIIYIQGQWTAFTNVISALWTALWNAIVDYFTQKRAEIETLVNLLISTITALWTAFKTTLSNLWNTAWDNIVNYITSAKDNILAAVQGIITDIQNTFSVDAFKELGTKIIDGIKQGILGGWDTITGLAAQLGDALVAAIKATLGIASPSSVFAEIGNNMTAGLAMGITGGAGAAMGAMNNVTNTIINNYNFSQTINGGVPSARQEFELMKSSALAFG